MRRRFFNWIRVDVFKVEQGMVVPKYLLWLMILLFPIDYWLSTQKHLSYDFYRDTIWINGNEFSMQELCNLKKGEIVKVNDLLMKDTFNYRKEVKK